nr:hypothetical transcript [Hymenolepis microstoma]
MFAHLPARLPDCPPHSCVIWPLELSRVHGSSKKRRKEGGNSDQLASPSTVFATVVVFFIVVVVVVGTHAPYSTNPRRYAPSTAAPLSSRLKNCAAPAAAAAAYLPLDELLSLLASNS